MCDADTCVLRRFDDILEQLDQPLPCVAGLQAHSPPFRVDHDETWRPLLALVGKTDKALAHSYSLDVRDRWEKGPVYFNYGFVFFNRAAFKQLAPLMDKYLSLALEGLGDNRLVAQVALTLALLGEDIKTVFLKHEYNCANDHILVGYKLVDLEDIRVIHYLRERDLKRREFLTERAAYRAFVDTPKANAVDERLRQLVLSFPELGSEFGGPPQAKPSRLGQTVVRNLLGNLVRRLRA
jgi:hypothetical protein